MKILAAPDSFKGSLSSIEVINIIDKVAKRHFANIHVIKVPIADGGEGTVDALVTAAGGDYREKWVTDPLGRQVKARYGILSEKTAVIEMAQASGLPLLSEEERNPLLTTSRGTGELIKAALDEGIRDIIIGIGGSATNDGGIGAAQALGIKFLDEKGADVGAGGRELRKIKDISLAYLDCRIRESRITVICDVNNPLTGENGATAVYGPQKGGTPESLTELEEGMKQYASVIKRKTGLDMDRIPGSGAAGGLGAALVGFLGGTLKPGIDTLLDLVNFDELLDGTDLVITGEGKLDGQSIFGKVPVGIAKHCKKRGVKVVAVAGSIGDDADAVYDWGIDSMMASVSRNMSLHEAMDNAEVLLENAVDRMFRLMKIGRDIIKDVNE